MQEFRCTKCGKLLGKVNNSLMTELPTTLVCFPKDMESCKKIVDSLFEVECRKCKTMNVIKA